MTRDKWTEDAPFHVMHQKINGAHVGYDIYCKNRPFLRQLSTDLMPDERTPRLKRPQAYAIAKVLNQSSDLRKWADKFGDPYV